MLDMQDAMNNCNTLYEQIRPIVNDVVSKNAKPIDDLIDKINKNLTNLSNKDLQDYMLQLSIETYYFSKIRDMSTLKQECALALLKEGQANSFNESDGTQSYRTNQATIKNLDKQAVSMLYNAVANNLRGKLDEAHRVLNVLSNVLISKNAEAKLKGARNEDDDLRNYNVTET